MGDPLHAAQKKLGADGFMRIKFLAFLFALFGFSAVFAESMRGSEDGDLLVAEEILCSVTLAQEGDPRTAKPKDQLVQASKRIILKNFPGAFNPSLIKIDRGLLLSFRYSPDPLQPWISYIGVVLLNDDLQQIGEPELLKTRAAFSYTHSQAEDARLFVYKGKLHILYNDNLDTTNPSSLQRRDMFMAKLTYAKGRYALSAPVKIFHHTKYAKVFWQKNWVPFEWNDTLLFSYMLNPHEVLYPDFEDGTCVTISESADPLKWNWGTLRGGTPALLVDGEYLAFFHSSMQAISAASEGNMMLHYYMGAYAFSANPPFEIKRISSAPIIGKGFYTVSSCEKRVIFPGGFVIKGSSIYVAYGKDDCEMWIATISKDKLKKSMQSVD